MKLDGKVAIVTGASSGIGKVVAERLSADGAIVAVNYRGDAAPAEALAAALRKGGRDAQPFQADVTKPEDRQRMVAEVLKRFGKIDILVSNAGVEHFGRLADLTPEDFNRVFSVNVAAQLFMTQAVAPHLPDGGRIVLTSSVSARFAIFHHTLYAASKAAVSAMVLNLAPELGERGITINAVAPGGTASRMSKENGKLYTPPVLKDVPPDVLAKSSNSLQRIGRPEEIASAVSFLVSPDASYVTGSTLAVDGGRL